VGTEAGLPHVLVGEHVQLTTLGHVFLLTLEQKRRGLGLDAEELDSITVGTHQTDRVHETTGLAASFDAVLLLLLLDLEHELASFQRLGVLTADLPDVNAETVVSAAFGLGHGVLNELLLTVNLVGGVPVVEENVTPLFAAERSLGLLEDVGLVVALVGFGVVRGHCLSVELEVHVTGHITATRGGFSDLLDVDLVVGLSLALLTLVKLEEFVFLLADGLELTDSDGTGAKEVVVTIGRLVQTLAGFFDFHLELLGGLGGAVLELNVFSISHV